MRLDLLVDTQSGSSCNAPGELVTTDLSVFRLVLPDQQLSSYGGCIHRVRYRGSCHNTMSEVDNLV
jgi:hypothetical protein